MTTKEDFTDFLHLSEHRINSLQFYFLNPFLCFWENLFYPGIVTHSKQYS